VQDFGCIFEKVEGSIHRTVIPRSHLVKPLGETRPSLPNGDIVSLSVAVTRIATRGVASSGKASVPGGYGELSNHQFDDGVGVFGSC
jgi:hypothetical protein